MNHVKKIENYEDLLFFFIFLSQFSWKNWKLISLNKGNWKNTCKHILFDYSTTLFVAHSFNACTLFSYLIASFPSTKMKASQTQI